MKSNKQESQLILLTDPCRSLKDEIKADDEHADDHLLIN